MGFRLGNILRLSDDQRAALGAYGARTTWPAGFAIYERDSRADGVFVVVRGSVVLRSHLSTGRTVVPWVATPGETFGEEGLLVEGRYTTSARAEEESETLHVGRTSLRAMMRELPDGALALLQQMAAERVELIERFCQHVSLTVEQRLIATMLRMTRASSEGSSHACAVVPRRLLGELVGATRESISLVLGRLSAEGLIRREGTGLRVLEREQLAERLARGLRDEPSRLADAAAVPRTVRPVRGTGSAGEAGRQQHHDDEAHRSRP